MYRTLALAVGLLFFSTPLVDAQGTLEDFQRANRLGRSLSGKVYRTNVSPNWLETGEHFWYRIKTGDQSHQFVLVDLQRGERMAAFDHQRVADQLSEQLDEDITPDNLPVRGISFSDDLQRVYFKHAGERWQLDRTTSEVQRAETDPPDRSTPSTHVLVPSRDKGGEIFVEFCNDSSRPVAAVWIDRNGRRVRYGSIAPRSTMRQHTFVGHVWLFLDPNDQAIGVYEANENETRFHFDGKSRIELKGTSRRRRSRPSVRGRAESPDKKRRIEIREQRLWVVDQDSGEKQEIGQFEKGRTIAANRIFWSPDSRYFVAVESEPGQQRQIVMVESAPKDQLQPKLHQLTYAKPGDRIRTDRPRIFDAQEMAEVEFDRSLLANPWSINQYQWDAQSGEFSFHFNQRGHQAYRIIAIHPGDGAVRTVVDETTDTFIDYTNKIFARRVGSDELIWMSERDGWNHLYLYDWSTGKIINQITSGEWVVRGVDRVDPDQRQIWFRASGMDPQQDPYFVHFCRINFDGSGLVRLTAGDGDHRIEYSPNGKYLIDRYSRVDMPSVTEVRRVDDGALVCQLESGELESLKATGWNSPQPFMATGRDDETEIWGVIYRPGNFDPAKKYPVIESIYAGPHGSFVPKSFRSWNQQMFLAELGFIVVQIDGMGTNNRSKRFHDVCWQNLGDSGFPDRIAWMQAAAREYPQMDLTRVGIYGGSAGGQSALRALLAFGDHYHVAVADCGCHDNRMDKIWWNEQWMGWPVGKHYEEQSNVTQAHRLKGKLMLIVGELDRNVDPASTMQVVKALIDADKDFDMLVVPGAGHGIGSGKYGMRRTRDFFIRHLHGVQPRREAANTE